MKTSIGILILMIAALNGAPAVAATADVPGVQRCVASWPAPPDTVERANAALVPTYTTAPDRFRVEANLVVRIYGTARSVASGIGVDADGERLSALHTTSCDGAIHVTAAESLDVHLWQLFQEWGVRLTQHCIGETCDAEGVRIVLDGHPVNMCPGAISIEDGTRIRLAIA
jgi:hypothetical protein